MVCSNSSTRNGKLSATVLTISPILPVPNSIGWSPTSKKHPQLPLVSIFTFETQDKCHPKHPKRYWRRSRSSKQSMPMMLMKRDKSWLKNCPSWQRGILRSRMIRSSHTYGQVDLMLMSQAFYTLIKCNLLTFCSVRVMVMNTNTIPSAGSVGLGPI